MATIPGLKADVYFGGIDKPLPDWRALAENKDDDNAEDSDDESPEDNALASAMLGFDPRELWPESDEDSEPADNEAELSTLMGIDLNGSTPGIQAPPGGITIGSRHYRSGEFIPAAVIVNASSKERLRLGC